MSFTKKEDIVYDVIFQYKAIFEYSSDQIFILDKNFRYLNVSKSVADSMGKKVDSFCGKTLREVYTGVDQIARFESNTLEVFKSGQSKNIGEKLVLGNDVLFINTQLSPIKNSKGEVVLVLGIVRNMSDMKKILDDLQTSEERYKLLFNESADAIMTLEPPTWRFTSGNPATIKMFGARDETDFISREPWTLSPEYQSDGKLSADKAKEMIQKAVLEGTNFFDWTHKRVGGEDFAATVLLNRIVLKDKIFLQATVRDITETKKSELALKLKADEMERFNKIAIERELRMVELKKKISRLEEELKEFQNDR